MHPIPAALAPDALRCEYTLEPLDVCELYPRLSWVVRDQRRGAIQSAYQVSVADSLGQLAHNQGNLWDSGKVLSSQTNQIEYAGKKLHSRQRCFWKVRCWDGKDQVSPWSTVSFWGMGLLDLADWKGGWIGSSQVGTPGDSANAPLLRKGFASDKPLVRATLYASALGLCELFLNGRCIGRDALTPDWTDYRKRIPYRAYDVTPLIRRGNNVAGAMLGDGWYCGHIGWKPRQNYGTQPGIEAQAQDHAVACRTGAGHYRFACKVQPGAILIPAGQP